MGEFEDALKVFEDNLTKMKKCSDHHLTVKLLNNIGSTQFAQQNISASLNAFFEVLEVQRTYFIKHFGSHAQQLDKNKLEDLKAGLQSMSFTLQNLAYVHAFIDDQSMSSFFKDTAVMINQCLITRAKEEQGLEIEVPVVPSDTIDV